MRIIDLHAPVCVLNLLTVHQGRALLAGRGDGGSVSKKEFAALVHRVIKEHRVEPEEVNLLYRIYDRNADGAIWLGELPTLACRLTSPGFFS